MKTKNKKTTVYLMATCLLFAVPFQSNATTNKVDPPTDISNPSGKTEADVLVKRLHEIKEIDKSTLNHSEKKALRNEIRVIKQDLNDNHGGVYISAGAVIIIILLLIILL